MRYIYSHSCLISDCEVIGICGIYVTFEGHICCWQMYAYNMINKVAVHCFVLPICAVLWGLHVDYVMSAVGHTCVVWQACSGVYANNV